MGETTYPLARSFIHPGWPKFQGSRWAFSKRQAVICWMAQLAAALWLGDPVRRGPYTSVRKCIVRMIWEWSFSSWRIFLLISGSAADWAGQGMMPPPSEINMRNATGNLDLVIVLSRCGLRLALYRILGSRTRILILEN